MNQQVLLGLACCTLAISVAQGADRTWDGIGGPDANWSTKQNWASNAVPSNGDSLFFETSNRLPNTNDIAGFLVAGITFNPGAGQFVLGGEPLKSNQALTLTGGITNSSSVLQTINVPLVLSSGAHALDSGAGGLTIGGVISGTGASITKSGSGILTLNGNNSYSGGTVLSAGTLTAGHNNAFGSGTLTVSGGTLALGIFSVSVPILVNSGSVSGSASSSNVTFNGAGAINGTFSGTVDLGNAAGRAINTSGGVIANAPLVGQGDMSGGVVTVNGLQEAGVAGTGAGIQRFSSGLIYGASSSVQIDLNGNALATAGTDYDQIQVNGGALSITAGATLRLDANGVDYSNAAWSSLRTFAVVQRSGSATFNGTSNFALDLTQAGAYASYGSWSLISGANGVDARWTPVDPGAQVPEPAVAMLGGLSLFGLLRRRRA